MTALLELQNVTRRFGGLVALDAVSFAVQEGGVTAVIGPNGAGKTTLFNIISGAHAPSGGRILFDGADVTGVAPERMAARGLVRTFQLVQLFHNLSTLENVKVGCHLHTRGGLLSAIIPLSRVVQAERDLDRKARELLAFVGLSDYADAPASALGYGQQRLLEIARALGAKPKLVLLDEPAAGLDAAETKRLAAMIRSIAERGTTVFLIEHDMNLVMSTADRVIVLDFGRKIAEGAPDDIRRDPAVVAAYLGTTVSGTTAAHRA
jgi:branched-chain amino acid transport system ATP-binding protein